MKAVSFKNRNVDVAANLYFPADFDASRQYPTIICSIGGQVLLRAFEPSSTSPVHSPN